jgi:hypothetical protein
MQGFDLEQLRTLVAVVDAGSLTAAAPRVFLSQSSVSEQIRKLEERAGQSLLVRSKAGVSPTEAGREAAGLCPAHPRDERRGVSRPAWRDAGGRTAPGRHRLLPPRRPDPAAGPAGRELPARAPARRHPEERRAARRVCAGRLRRGPGDEHRRRVSRRAARVGRDPARVAGLAGRDRHAWRAGSRCGCWCCPTPARCTSSRWPCCGGGACRTRSRTWPRAWRVCSRRWPRAWAWPASTSRPSATAWRGWPRRTGCRPCRAWRSSFCRGAGARRRSSPGRARCWRRTHLV